MVVEEEEEEEERTVEGLSNHHYSLKRAVKAAVGPIESVHAA